MIESIMKLHSCADCSIRCKAEEKPRSIFASIHRWHSTWWPGWKMYKVDLRTRGARATARG